MASYLDPSIKNFANPDYEDTSLACTLTDYLLCACFAHLSYWTYQRSSKNRQIMEGILIEYPGKDKDGLIKAKNARLKVARFHLKMMSFTQLNFALAFGTGGLTHHYFYDKNSWENQLCWFVIHRCLALTFVSCLLSPVIYFRDLSKGMSLSVFTTVLFFGTLLWVVVEMKLVESGILQKNDSFALGVLVYFGASIYGRGDLSRFQISTNLGRPVNNQRFFLCQVPRIVYMVIFLVIDQTCNQEDGFQHGCPFPDSFNHNAMLHMVCLTTFYAQFLCFTE